MPYVDKEARPLLLKDPNKVRNVGDLNFLYSNIYKALWIKEKGYKTIEFICAIGLSHETPQFIKELDVIFQRRGFKETQLVRAKFLAFYEFMRRVGDYYEDGKIIQNGDVYGDIEEATVKIPVDKPLNPGAKKRGRPKKNG